MRSRGTFSSEVLTRILAAAAGLSIACGSAAPRNDAERLARGREIIERMSKTLGSAQAFSVTTTEVRDEVTKDKVKQVTLTRETTVRRPDRLYSKVSGDRHNEVWYDGVGITLVMHADKVFGQARAPETLDKTLDALQERFGVSMPFADYLYSSPAKALLAETTTGGWVGREKVNGQPTDHLSFKDMGVNWEAWISASGDPLPQRAIAEFRNDKRLRKIDMTFKDWNLSARIGDDRFSPTVPPDYEGVAIVQHARVLKNAAK
jgi:hypothetical protein